MFPERLCIDGARLALSHKNGRKYARRSCLARSVKPGAELQCCSVRHGVGAVKLEVQVVEEVDIA